MRSFRRCRVLGGLGSVLAIGRSQYPTERGRIRRDGGAGQFLQQFDFLALRERVVSHHLTWNVDRSFPFSSGRKRFSEIVLMSRL